MKAIKTELENGKVSSVLIQTDNNLEIWFDVWEENDEITGDWNKFIFDLKDTRDLDIKEFQNDSNNFMECLEIAEEVYERYTDFTPHGGYTVSNSGGYLIELSSCGEMARIKDNYGNNNPYISEWLPIEYVESEDGELDEDGQIEYEPVIDPEGYNIPLNQVMRI